VHAAIDVSDGLLQDLSHILTSSGCGAQILETHLPIHSALLDLPRPLLRQAALAGGDLYELCFTAPQSERAAVQLIGRELNIPMTLIGTITLEPGLQVCDAAGAVISELPAGFDHFRA
jgi:thiamine-monophosphate kinase